MRVGHNCWSGGALVGPMDVVVQIH